MDARVLLIEDEPNIREAVRFILARDGFEVAIHGDGRTAAEVATRDPPSVVVLDLMLPGRSGLDVLRELRAHPATRATPVLMLTARGQERDRRAALNLGATRFMTKPFSNAAVLDAVRELARAGDAEEARP